MLRTYLAAVALLCISAPTFSAEEAAVMAEPDQVHFSKMEDSATIRVMIGDKPLPSRSLTGARVVIGKSDYSHQFKIERSKTGPATITLAPNPETAQVGTFTLVISTKAGDVLVAVEMPLDQIPGTLEDRAKQEGVTVDEMKAKLGLSQEGKRETLTVLLPKRQYVGSTFTLRIPASPGRDYTWKVDGKVVLQGIDENVLKYVLDKTGNRYIELEAREAGATVVRWSGVLQVVEYPEMLWQVRKGKSFSLRATGGYRSHEWRIDGHGAGKDEILTHTFKEAGEHLIECTSRNPVHGEPEGFITQRWKTTVR
ncbi:MAG: hypothetical protein HUU46_20590 [Candidatus Hydrogenedentes bacterium]|nr:hypothetical protein [Candidatus Hydrogenedentota bacterium]